MTVANTQFGVNRVLNPLGALPQAAHQLDPHASIAPTEARVSVEQLNLDSASFTQLAEAHGADPQRMAQAILAIVDDRGKMQNPVTGSGGVLIGTVTEVGEERDDLAIGDRVVTLVSLTATPLHLTAIAPDWRATGPVVPVSGTAILTDGAIYSTLPDDIAEDVALSVLDVCGAPALTRRILQRPMLDEAAPSRLLILGGGKSATLSAIAARSIGVFTTIVVPTELERSRLIKLDIADEVLVCDATDPLRTRAAVLERGALADVTLVCVNVPGVEHAALVSTREKGAVVFFSMATSFSTVALGAEALGLDLELFIGSGYVPGHAAYAFDLVREHESLRQFFGAGSRQLNTHSEGKQ